MKQESDVGGELLRLAQRRVASLGAMLDGHPLVSLVLFDAAPDLSVFHIHISRLAQHAKALEQNPKVGLLIADEDGPSRNPQTLARLSIRGFAELVDPSSVAFEEARESYLKKYPQSRISFQLPDFFFVRIQPAAARLVTGFGGIHDFNGESLCSLARQAPDFE